MMEGKRRHRRLRQITKIWEAQQAICAGCGRTVPPPSLLARSHNDAPTFDHVIPKSAGGSQSTSNGIMKHRLCNRERASRLPTGCDFVWQLVVWAELVIPAAQSDAQLSRTIEGGLPLGKPWGETLRQLLPTSPINLPRRVPSGAEGSLSLPGSPSRYYPAPLKKDPSSLDYPALVGVGHTLRYT